MPVSRHSARPKTLEVPKASDVGVIFEVMNNRGKKLTDMEKVKNYMLYVCTKLAECGGEDLAAYINDAWCFWARRMPLNWQSIVAD